jgi:hypothetical protein
VPEPSGARPEGSTPKPEPTPPDEAKSAEDTATGPVVEAPPSNLARLRASFEAAREDRREVIQIAPGIYGGNLAARYRPIEWADTRKKIAKLQARGASDEQALDFAATQLCKAVEEILVRPTDADPLRPAHEVVPEFRGSPVRYDERLAQMLGIELTGQEKPREICRLVFIDANVLDTHFSQFDFWLRGLTEGETDDELDEAEDLAARPT